MPPTEPTMLPRRSVDAHGRALPMTEEEVRARAEQAIRALDALDDMGDEEEQRQTLEILLKAQEEGRLAFRMRPPE